ncbi:FtsX-like permease family protein [Nakamurella aerolata]|uniref:FtsX-like permease family protein n=1 Tax=Nakamurella aerolata TaxID=1656892 RepID=A0A849A788_9ACTN|nr:FtsX-like permease family protein [Nakamurella aerolata]NNG36355.1 FtsX-like permease family protein [Nakamurella aerolata]
MTFGLGRLQWRQLRRDVGPLLLLWAMTVLLAGIATAAPAAGKLVALRDLRASSEQLAPSLRDLVQRAQGALPAGSAPAPAVAATGLPADAAPMFGATAVRLQAVRASFPTQVQQLTSPARFVQVSVSALALTAPSDVGAQLAGVPTLNPWLRQQTTLVAGQWPQAPVAGGAVPVVVGKTAADAAKWPVGQVREIAGSSGAVKVQLTGIVDYRADDEHFSQMERNVLGPNIFDDGNSPRRVGVQVFTSAAGWPRLMGESGAAPAGGDGPRPLSVRTVLWYPLLVDKMGSTGQPGLADPVSLAAAFRSVATQQFPLQDDAPAGRLAAVKLTTDLPETLDEVAARTSSAAAVQTLAALGPLGAALGVMVLGMQALLRRRMPTVRLLLSRGASGGQIRRSLLLQGALIGLLGAVPVMLAVQLVSGVWLSWPWLLAGVGCGLLPAVLPAVAVSTKQQRSVREEAVSLGGRRRVLWEAALVALAALSLQLLLAGGSDGAGADLLSAAAPVLLTLAACVLVIRLYPLPLRALVVALRRRRGAVGFLGAVRSVREPLIGAPLVIATVISAAVAMFSLVTLSTVSTGITDQAQRAVGADLSVSGRWMLPDLVDQAGRTPGVAAVAAVGQGPALTVRANGTGPATTLTTTYADTAQLGRIQQGIPGLAPVPAGMATVESTKTGTFGSISGGGATVLTDVPVMLADATYQRLGRPATLTVNDTTLRVVGTSRYPPVNTTSADWVLFDRTPLRALTKAALPTQLLVSLRPGADQDKVRAELTAVLGPGLQFTTPAAKRAELSSAPTIAGMQGMLIAATVAAVTLMVLALLVTVVAVTGLRNRLIAVLQMLGMNQRQVAVLTAWEQAPAAATALLAGGGVGVLLAMLVRAVANLKSFTGAMFQPDLVVPGGPVTVLVAGFVLLLVVALVGSAVSAARVSVVELLRTEES